MAPTPDLSIIIPAYNEGSRIGPTVRDLVDYCRGSHRVFEVILVDDGSEDDTGWVGRQLCQEFDELRLIRLAANQGKGYAVRTGMLNALGHNLLFADADGATPFRDVERLEGALAGGADIAVGSRALRQDGTRVKAKLYRHLMGRTFHFMVEQLADVGVKDTQCGFKLFRFSVAQELFSRMRMNGFSFDVEVLLMARKRGYQVTEVPVNWTHQPGSKVRLAGDSAAMAIDLFRIRANWLRGGYGEPHLAAWGPNNPPAPSFKSAG
jgi:dolichyl-phosphate beta-glucosyltransferase